MKGSKNSLDCVFYPASLQFEVQEKKKLIIISRLELHTNAMEECALKTLDSLLWKTLGGFVEAQKA